MIYGVKDLAGVQEDPCSVFFLTSIAASILYISSVTAWIVESFDRKPY